MRRQTKHLLLAERARHRHRRWRLAGFVFVSAAVISLLAAQAGPEGGWAERARFNLVDAFAPLMSAVRAPMAAVAERVTGLASDTEVQGREDGPGSRDVEMLRQKADALEANLAELARLAEVAPVPGLPYVMAEVIGTGGRVERREVIVSAGAVDGVATGQAVVADGGFVGVVAATGKTTARVRLLGDPGFTVGVLVGSAMLPGRVSRGPGRFMVLDMPDLDYQISEGDRVVTAGERGVMPRGLAVGRVVIDSQRLGVDAFTDGRSRRFLAILDAEPADVTQGEASALAGGKADAARFHAGGRPR